MDNDVSMQDIARVAGVSLSTASRALADSPRVKLETRRRIQDLAEEMGYLPNAIARGLATRRTYTLGVVVRDIVDPFIAELVRTIDKAALDCGYSVILSNCGADPQREMTAIKVLRQHCVDGIIVPDIIVGDASFQLLEEVGVPVILVNKKCYPYSVGTDNVDGAEQAVNHLLGLGHERIAYIGNRHRAESLERQTGYRQALMASGISPEPALVFEGDDNSPQEGWYGVEQLMSLARPPSAIFCFDDLTAVGVIGAAHAAGLYIPDHLSVVGFDDIDLAPYLVPPLTTVAQQTEKIAQLTVDMVLKLLAGKMLPANTTLPGRLVVRGSTASPDDRLDRVKKSKLYPYGV